MNRRGFIGSILAACAAPAIVRADSLMRVVPLETTVFPGIAGSELWAHARPLDVSIDEFLRLYVRPAMANLAAGIERDCFLNVGAPIKIRNPNAYMRRAG